MTSPPSPRTAPTFESRTRLAHAIARRPLEWFVVLTFALSWAPAVSYLATGSGPALLGCGPFLAAFAVLSVTHGREGLRSLRRAMTAWRVPARWWAVAIGLPIAMTLLAAGVNLALGASSPGSDDVGNWTNVLPTALLILLVPVFGGAWEEPGWRGYALPRLLRDRSPLAASLVLGAIWAVWHLPIFLTGEQHWSDLLLIVAVAVVLTWIFQNAMQSVLVAMVFHALNNAISGEYVSQWFDGSDSTRQSWILAVLWTVFAVAVAKHSPGFRRRSHLGRPAVPELVTEGVTP